MQAAISKTVAASGSSLADARTASRLDRMLSTLAGARRAMQVARESAAADAAALAECRLQLQQSAQVRTWSAVSRSSRAYDNGG